MLRIAGIGELIFSNAGDDILKTYALASCVAVIAYSAADKRAGLIHIALPHSGNGEDMKKRPHYYAESGIPLLIDGMCLKYGCKKNALRVSVFGGAESARKDDIFNIGAKNIAAVKRILTLYGILICREETGGNLSRTVEIDTSTGLITVRSLRFNY